MESNENVQVKPSNINNINNNIAPKMPPIEKKIREMYDDFKVGKRNREVIINNDYNNSNPQTTEKIEVNIAEKNKELYTTSKTSKIKVELKSKFLIKVYGILLFQFIIIFGFVLIFQIKSISSYIKTHP